MLNNILDSFPKKNVREIISKNNIIYRYIYIQLKIKSFLIFVYKNLKIFRI
jgi:hypothetical protein